MTPIEPKPSALESELKRLAELEGKATKGPWEKNQYSNFTGYSLFAKEFGCVTERWAASFEDPSGPQHAANGEFIAAIRNAAPSLIEGLRVAVEALSDIEWHELERRDAINKATEALSRISKLLSPGNG